MSKNNLDIKKELVSMQASTEICSKVAFVAQNLPIIIGSVEDDMFTQKRKIEIGVVLKIF